MGLVITRRRGEAIRIGDSVLIEIGQISEGKVRLRITAPQDVKILRSELLEWTDTEVDHGKE